MAAMRKWIVVLLVAGFEVLGAAPQPEAWFVDSLTKIFSDDPAGTAAVPAAFDAARRSHVAVQVALRAGQTTPGVTVEAPPLRGPGAPISSIQVRWVEYVNVDSNSTRTPEEELVRKAPGRFPDALLEEFPITLQAGETRSIWLTVRVPADQRPGEYKGEVRLLAGGKPLARLPYRLRVYAATVPSPIPLAITNYMNLSDGLFKRHFGISRDSPEGWEAIGNIARFLGQYHQNGVFQNTPRLVRARLENGVMRYSFDDFDRFFGTFIDAGVNANIQGGNLMSRERRKGATIMVEAWVEENGQPVLTRVPLEDPRSRAFLNSYLPALYQHLRAKGWEKKYMQGVMDEPTELETEAFAEVAELVRKHMPGVRIVEPMSLRLNPDFLSRHIDVWVMHLGTIEKGMDLVEQQARAGRELWYYTSLTPRGRYPNRLIDFSLLKVRILHWLNFKYGLTGYLHWGANYWSQDPFKNTQPIINQGRTLLPPGDAFITYPNRAKRTFYSSIRLEQMRAGIEDYGLLAELSRKQPEEARRLAGEAMQSFTEYVREPERFRVIHRALLEALSK
jgi:hypothetical protein